MSSSSSSSANMDKPVQKPVFNIQTYMAMSDKYIQWKLMKPKTKEEKEGVGKIKPSTREEYYTMDRFARGGGRIRT